MLLSMPRTSMGLLPQLRPLFPSYIFISLNQLELGLQSLDITSGISRFVTFNGRPDPLPRGIMEVLIAMTDDNGIFRLSSQVASRPPDAEEAGFDDAGGCIKALQDRLAVVG